MTAVDGAIADLKAGLEKMRRDLFQNRFNLLPDIATVSGTFRERFELLGYAVQPVVLTWLLMGLFRHAIDDRPIYVISGLVLWLGLLDCSARALIVKTDARLPEVAVVAKTLIGRVALMMIYFSAIYFASAVTISYPPVLRAPGWLALLGIGIMFGVMAFGIAMSLRFLRPFTSQWWSVRPLLYCVGLFTPAVVYPMSMAPKLLRYTFFVSPLSPFLEASRSVLVLYEFPPMLQWIWMAAWAAASVCCAALLGARHWRQTSAVNLAVGG